MGILLADLARGFDQVRRPRQGLLDRLETALIQRLRPDFHEVQRVRGDGVAADLLARAAVRQGGISRCELFAPASSAPVWNERLLDTEGRFVPRQRLKVNSFSTLVRGLDAFELSAWFDPNASLAASLQIRRSFASRLYPVTSVVHGFSAHLLFHTFFLRSLLVGTYPCDSVVCPSRACRDGVARIFARIAEAFNQEHGTRLAYGGRFDVIPMCVDTDALVPQDKPSARAHLGLKPGVVVLLYLGYLSLWKADLLPLLRVFASLVKSEPHRELMLVIAGTQHGSHSATLSDYTASLGVGDSVRFILAPSDDAKGRLLSAADIFVSPVDNLQESFGLAPVEAMSCGTPPVVADWDGYRETVTHGETGFLVPTRWAKCDGDLQRTGLLLGWDFDHLCLGQSVCVDTDALEFFLRNLVEHPTLRASMGEQARRRAIELYSFAAVMRRYRELWLELAEIARGLGHTHAQANAELSSYWDTFHHYASHHVSDDAVIVLTPEGAHALAHGLNVPLDPDILRAGTIDPDLLSNVLSTIDAESTLGSVRDRVAAHREDHPDRITRHVLWLMKHGLAKPRL